MLFENAPAKINLTLSVRGKNHNGYHELESFISFTELSDTLRGEIDSDLQLTVIGEFEKDLSLSLRNKEDNLVLQAAYLLQKESNTTQGARLMLEKNLPIMGGLGGGSSDAAASLRLLNRLWKLDWSLERLMPLAEKLGADVPACLHCCPCVVTGWGECIRLLPSLPILPEWRLLLANPQQKLSTQQVFSIFDVTSEDRIYIACPNQFTTAEDMMDYMRKQGNHLMKSACIFVPEIQDLCVMMMNFRASYVALSGSGSSCFAFYDNERDICEAKRLLEEQYPNYWFRDTSLRS